MLSTVLLSIVGLLTFSSHSSVELNSWASHTTFSPTLELKLTTEILKESYCEGPDADLVMLRLLLRLSFTNKGSQKVIFQRGAKLVPVIKVSSTVEDALAGRFETIINNSIIMDDSGSEKLRKRPPLSSFTILSPGETYDTIADVSIPVPRNKPVSSIINSGEHYLQIGVWTWNDSPAEARQRRATWKREGFLWSESVLSYPMRFLVRSQPIAEDCSCALAKVGETKATAIATDRLKAKGYSVIFYKSMVIGQGCEWQIIFQPTKTHANKPSLVFMIDKNTGRTLAEYE